MVVCETYISSLFSVIYINLNITSPSRAESDATTTTDDARADVHGPTPTRGPNDYLGTVLVARGAMLTDLSRTRVAGTEPPEAIAARENLGLVWGPLAGHWGMFFLVFGLLAAAGFTEDV